ncbi:MAG: extracellular solute-binding protein [Anaerolineae bacterium]|nr:extracellular solute-binding protein [Anaerolineae bacterium]
MKKSSLFLVSLFVILAMLLVACGSSTEESAEEPASTTAEEAAPADDEAMAEDEAMADDEAMAEDDSDSATEPSGNGERTEVRWYVGLGAGSDEPMFAPQEQVVADYNASQDEIELVLEIVDADQAFATLATQIAAGNAPDIVGPVGIRGRDFFRGAWVDLQPYIDAEGYDLSDFDPALVEFYVDKAEGQLGLPFAIFPSFLSINYELFDEGGIPYPPQEYGAPYVNVDGEEVPWDIDAMREVALLLTVDANGNDATSPDFDPDNIVQFGYYEQWTDFRGAATLFGPGSLVDENGNAQVPDQWRDAAEWFYDGMWNEVFYPNGIYDASDVIAGNGFESGNVAMSHTHLWYYGCCVGNIDFDYGLAAMPANEYTGEPTAKMHADTFGILKGGDNPDAAWEVLKYFLGENAETMTQMYGGMPARLSLQDAYFDTFQTTVPNGENLNWQVVVDSMAYADNPNHEAYMPSPQEANEAYNAFWSLLGQEPDRDVQADIDKLVVDLQAIYDAAGNE